MSPSHARQVCSGPIRLALATALPLLVLSLNASGCGSTAPSHSESGPDGTVLVFGDATLLADSHASVQDRGPQEKPDLSGPGATDAGVDAAERLDGSGTPDTGSTDGPRLDSTTSDGTATDGAVEDAAVEDAAVEDTAGRDVGSTEDGSEPPVDAGQVTPPSCGISAHPAIGFPDTEFSVTWHSDAAQCSRTINGERREAVPCSDQVVVEGSELGIGMHSIVLDVQNGPQATNTCRAELEVHPCTATIYPAITTVDRPFDLSWSSAGTTCSWSIDQVDQGPVSCNGKEQLIGTALGLDPGTYTFALVIRTGPGAGHSCRAALILRWR